MESYLVNNIILQGHFLGSEILSVFLVIFLYGVIIALWRYYKKDGLFLYNIIAVVLANIQVLKNTTFIFSKEPVALGTLLFATTFVVNDILTEHFGIEVAKKSIKISIIAQILTTILMIFTLAYPTGGNFNGKTIDSSLDIIDQVQFSLYVLFVPSVRILFSSLVAYYIAQWFDIKIFQLLKDYTNNKFAWLRLNLSTMISGLLDNILFSTLAWVILNPNPVTLKSLIMTYILGTYVSRVIISITSTPLIYLTYKYK